jgi:excisionase family DNA binding protein
VEVLTLAELPDVLTVEEAARVLRVGRNAAYELVRQGVVPSIRLGRRLLVPKLGLLRLLSGGV